MPLNKLLTPTRIGSLELRNRLVLAPMGTNFADADGFVTERIRRHYAARAAGGAGLIIAGDVAVDIAGRNLEFQLTAADDRHIPGLTELAAEIHRHGAAAALQLVHGGKLAMMDINSGVSPLAPSELRISFAETMRDLTRAEIAAQMGRVKGEMARRSHQMTPDEIAAMVRRFADAAARAQQSGFDGIEIHAGHGYLIASFLSPAVNQRDDAYGGSPENRARFLLEIIAAIRDRLGVDYPLWCRIDGREWGIKNGITLEDGVALAKLIEAAGADAVHVSGYGGTVNGFIDAPLAYPPGNLVADAAAVKRAVGIPVIAVGRIDLPRAAKLIADGEADLVALARPLLADPELPNKLTAGKPETVRPCIYCYRCVSQHLEGKITVCTVNPAVGDEDLSSIPAAAPELKIAVIGGGPTGLETARRAVLAGHAVTLYEASARLGGSLSFAAVVNPEIASFRRWLIASVKDLSLKVRLNCRATPEMLAAEKPDVTVLATGPRLVMPEIKLAPGAPVLPATALRGALSGQAAPDAFGGLTGLMLRLARPLISRFSPELLSRLARYWLPLGKRVAIVGGDLGAVELAQFLVASGRAVTLLAADDALAPEMAIPARWRVLKELRRSGVEIITGARIAEINRSCVRLALEDDKTEEIPADSVVLAGETLPTTEMRAEFAVLLPRVHQIGDAAAAGLIPEALTGAARLVRGLNAGD